MKSLDRLSVVVGYVLIYIFAAVVFHAPFSVFFSQFFTPELIKSWKEILMIMLAPVVLAIVIKDGLFKRLIHDRLVQLIGVFALLHIFLLLYFSGSAYQEAAGLAIDLRYLLFFVIIYCTILILPHFRKKFLLAGGVSACLSVVFAALQATLLPKDFLTILGYSKHTIAPYLNVDENSEFIRINGTLRGPNPLGAYAVVIGNILSAWVVLNKKRAAKYRWILVGGFLFILVVLWSSYSRSAWLAFCASLLVLIFIVFHKKLQMKYVLVGFMTLGLLVFSASIFSHTSFVQNVILHNNPTSGGDVDSNSAHADSVESGIKTVLLQPYGAGIGSTGSASLRSQNPIIIENQYVHIAHESGWFGLALFFAIFTLILYRLYCHRKDWLSLGVFSSGIGLSLIGLFLPVWVDDTVSVVWFGLAAIALASQAKRRKKYVKSSN